MKHRQNLISVRITPEIESAFNELSKLLGKTKSALFAELVEFYASEKLTKNKVVEEISRRRETVLDLIKSSASSPD